MAQDIQSIEDLISESQGDKPVGDETTQAKFQKKQEEIKIKEMERVAESMASSLGVQYISLYGFPIGPDSLKLIPEEEARRYGVVCFFYNGKSIKLGALNPQRDEVIKMMEDLSKKYHAKAELFIISAHSLQHAFGLYRTIPKVREVKQTIEVTEDDLNHFSEKFSSFKDLQKEIDNAQITDIVTMTMAAAIKSESSDIHIEAEEEAIKVRFRIDGVLHDSATIDKELWKKIISRMKVLAKVKINVTDKPQDGRMSIDTSNERIDIRASFLPTNYGESVVMRLLRSSSVGLEFDDLGIRGRAFEQLKKEIEKPNGMVITTGPTGSGKTTTLYAILKKLNNQETKIITIEDPIEYQLEGINQSQTSDKYTFAQGLRSIVRQDPDVVMVGEVRDLETAEIAIQAALTGHLVLSTIHTNDAAGTVPRLISMGTKPFLLAPALNAMIGQRLVRRVCENCKTEDKIDDKTKERIAKAMEELPQDEKNNFNIDNAKFYKGGGCDICQGIGYKGRIGIYEIMTINEEVSKLILSGKASEYDMRHVSQKNGMVTMLQDGILKAADGITSISEVFRVAKESN